MNTINIWVSKILDDGVAYIHHEQPNKDTDYWESNDKQVVINELFGNQLGLKAGECMEWVMVEKGDFEKMKKQIKNLSEKLLEIQEEIERYEP